MMQMGENCLFGLKHKGKKKKKKKERKTRKKAPLVSTTRGNGIGWWKLLGDLSTPFPRQDGPT